MNVFARWFATGCFLGLLAFGPAGADDVVLATVDGGPITLADLKEDFERRHQGHMSILADEDVVRDFLNAAIKRRLFIQEGRRIALNESPEIVERVAAERVRVATQWLYRTEVSERVKVTAADVAAALPAARVKYEMIRVRTDSEAEARAAERRIAEGEPAEDVARAVSVARSRLRSGLEGIDWGTLPAALQAAVWAADDGDLVGPVETDAGWELGLIVARKGAETDNEKRDESFVRTVLERRELERIRASFLDDLRERYGARIQDELLAPEVLAPLVENAASGAVDPRPLATYEGGAIALGDFVASIRARSFLELRPGQQRRQAGQLLSNQLDQALLELEAARRWDEAPADVRADVGWFEDDMVFRALLDRVVFKDLGVTDEKIGDYLEAHRDEYVEPPKARLGIALLETEEAARTFLRDLESGSTFDELARRRSRDHDTASRGGDAGWIAEKQAIGPLRGAPFAAAVGDHGGPLRLDSGWLVYTVLDHRDAEPLPEEKSRAQIRAELTKEASRQRMEEWERQLRDVAEIKISDRGLRKAGKILQQERVNRRLEAMPASHPAPAGGAR